MKQFAAHQRICLLGDDLVGTHVVKCWCFRPHLDFTNITHSNELTHSLWSSQCLQSASTSLLSTYTGNFPLGLLHHDSLKISTGKLEAFVKTVPKIGAPNLTPLVDHGIALWTQQTSIKNERKTQGFSFYAFVLKMWESSLNDVLNVRQNTCR